MKRQPRRLLASVRGLELAEMAAPEVCCGFGGTFCVKYPEVSTKMVADKTADIARTGAALVLAGDLGCLLNIAGRLKRQGSPVQVRHVAEVLAGDLATPAIGEPASVSAATDATTLEFRRNATRAIADPPLQEALGQDRGRLGRGPRPRRRAPARVRAAARPGGGDQGPHAGQPRPLPRGVRGQGPRARRRGPLGPRRRRGACRSCSTCAAPRARARSPRARA